MVKTVVFQPVTLNDLLRTGLHDYNDERCIVVKKRGRNARKKVEIRTGGLEKVETGTGGEEKIRGKSIRYRQDKTRQDKWADKHVKTYF